MSGGQDFPTGLRFEGLLGDLQAAIAEAFSPIGSPEVVIDGVMAAGTGWGVSFALVWEGSNPTAAIEIVNAVRAYGGRLEWRAASDVNWRGTRISAFPPNTVLPSPGGGVSASALVDEVADLGIYLRRTLGSRGISVTFASPIFAAEEAYGMSAYEAYLVRSPGNIKFDDETSELMPTSPEDVRLNVAVLDGDLDTLGEELRTAGLLSAGVGDTFYSNLLWRHERIILESEEVGERATMLSDLLSHLKKPGSVRVIGRLLRICSAAVDFGLGVLLEPTR